MITELGLRRFKRFKALDLELARLTVLTGLNSAGKTSTIQGLLLLRSALRGDGVVALHDAQGLALGEPSDVLHHGSGEETIELSVRARDIEDTITVRLEVPDDEHALYLKRLEAPDETPHLSALLAPEPAFTYLCAERHGPRDILAAAATDLEHLGVGVYGERTAQVLNVLGRQEVREARLAPDSAGAGRSSHILLRQTQRWLAHILGLDGVMDIEARWIEGTSVTSLRFKARGMEAEWTRPQNVGFGISYVLPIVVAALQAPQDGLLVIENPEAHLHPAGQSAMGAFLAQVAADGVQVVLETHSDHIINGIRRAVAEKAVPLAPEDVGLLFFYGSRAPDAANAPYERIGLRESGELTAWPPGFFDQIEQDLGAIARARRGARRRR